MCISPFSLASCVLAAIPFTVGDWPQWRGPNHDNVSLETGWSPVGAGQPLWVGSIGLGYSSPAIAEGQLVITGYIDSEDSPGEGVDRVSCLSADTGELHWQREYPATIYNNEHAGGVLSTPTIADGIVYVASRAGGLRAYALETGELHWELDLVQEHQVDPARYGFSSSPFVLDDLLILNAGATFAFERESGETVWVSENHGASFSTVAPIQLGERSGLVVFGSKGLAVVDANDGTLMHNFVFRKGNRNVEGATPIVIGERVFISSGYEQGGVLVDFGGDEPELVWRTRRMRNKMAGSTLWQGHLYGFDESMLKCIDLEGNELWRQRGLGQGALSIADGHLLLTTSRGELIVAKASPDGFVELYRTQVIEGGSFWAAPVLVDGRIYVRGSEGQLACLDHRSAPGDLRDPLVTGTADSDLPSSAELSQAHLVACGLDKQELPGLRMTGLLYVKALGLDGVQGLWEVSRDGRWHTKFDLPPTMQGTIQMYFDGEFGWEDNPYSGDALLKPHLLSELRALGGPISLLAPLPKELEIGGAALETFHGVPCYRVDVPGAENSVRSVYFSVETNRLRGRSADNESTVLFDDWREVDGLVLPFRRTEFDALSGEERRWLFDGITFEAPVAALFEIPEPIQALLTPAAESEDQVAADPAQEQVQAMSPREKDFAALLTGAELVGFFSQTGPEGGASKEDRYTITRVSKADGDDWLFEANIQFGGRDIPIRLQLPVLWAGETPVITVTDMGFPLLGKYSARVLFHADQYAGVWSGEGYGGQMWGHVEPMQEEPAPELEEASKQSIHWPSFRGPAASGVADGPAIPTRWDVTEGTNIRWHLPFPGLAHSSPVIWGDRLFLTTAVHKDGTQQELKVGLYGGIAPVMDESEFRFELHCLDKNTGEPLWSRLCWQGVPAVKRHPKGSHAASTPATDGKRVLAFFGGEGLYCYDMDGNPLWQRDLGPMDSGYFMMPMAQWGFASSPVLHGDTAIVQCDQQGASFIAALDANTGEERWRTARDEVPTWSTPTVLVTEDRKQVICNGFKRTAGYDLESGKELWNLVMGGGDIPVPTPIVSDGLIFITNAHGGKAPIFALEASLKGEVKLDPAEEPFMAWTQARRGNYMQTPLAYGDAVYFCTDAGIMSSFEKSTGKQIYRERLGVGRTGFTSSPVAANGHLYYASEEGDVHVVRAGEFELVSINPLGEECMATPAISEGVLYYRTRGNIVAVGF